jgi:hypothetical protein
MKRIKMGPKIIAERIKCSKSKVPINKKASLIAFK